jgi:hypothetical protein
VLLLLPLACGAISPNRAVLLQMALLLKTPLQAPMHWPSVQRLHGPLENAVLS